MSKTTHAPTNDSQAAGKNGPSPDAADAAVRQPPADVNLTEEAVAQAIEQAAAEAVAADQGPSQIEQLQSQLAVAEDRVLRAHAELDNYRKRANRLLQEETKYAPLPLLRDLLPVVDNLERAIQSADQNGGSAGLLAGVRMVAELLHTVLERHHCRRIEAKGAAFDPRWHEAIAQIPSQELPPGTVAEVVLAGYQLHDRVVRPAQVLIATRPPAEIGD